MTRYSADDDATLVNQTLQGRKEAFGRLYDRYARLVRATVHDPGRDPAAVEDLVQETFLRAYRLLPRLRDPVRFGAWLAGIARRVACEDLRSRRRSRVAFAYPPDTPAPPPAGPDADELTALLDAVSRLPARERLAVHAFYLDDGGLPRVAELLGLSRSGAYALLRRALDRLACRLSEPVRSEETHP
jgi:RNA polymerase sigma-70 factor (ECF subfamily)